MKEKAQSLRPVNDPGDGPSTPPAPAPSANDVLRSKIMDQARGTSIEIMVGSNLSNVVATDDVNAEYDPVTKTIRIPSKTSQALADFIHEYTHEQQEADTAKKIADIFKAATDDPSTESQQEAAIKVLCLENEAQAVAAEIFYLGQIPSSGSSGNALTTIGSNSQYVSLGNAIAIFREAATELGLNPKTGANSPELLKLILQKVRLAINPNSGLDTANKYISDLKKLLHPSGNGGGGGETHQPSPPPPNYPFPFPPSEPAPPPLPPVPDMPDFPPPPPLPPLPPVPPPPGQWEVGDPQPSPPPSGGGGGGGGCVAVSSYLPGGKLAGEVTVGATLELADEASLQAATGEVSYSQRKTQPGYRIVTQSGIALVCSSTAPIPTLDGLVLAPQLKGRMVATRRTTAEGYSTAWEAVEVVVEVGPIEVQHITVSDRSFWAGESADAFILHHNMKAEDPGPEDPPWWGWGDVRQNNPGDTSRTGGMPPAPKPEVSSRIDTLGASLTHAMAGFSAPDGNAGSMQPLSQRLNVDLLPPQ